MTKKKQSRFSKFLRGPKFTYRGLFIYPDGEIQTIEDGKFKTSKRKLQDISSVVIEKGEDAARRISGKRIAAGVVLLGPIGGVLGGLMPKNTGGEHYVVIEGEDFIWSEKVPPGDLKKARKFVSDLELFRKSFH